MEAKETIISRKDIHDLFYYSAGGFPNVDKIVEKQAEISFKAGIREVVEWLETHLSYSKMFGQSPFEWQAKLREWGVDKPKK